MHVVQEDYQTSPDQAPSEAETLHDLEQEIMAAAEAFETLQRRLGAPGYRMTGELELMAQEQRTARLVSLAQGLRRELQEGDDAELAEEAARIHTLAYLVWLDMHLGSGEGRLRKRHRGELAPLKRNLERAMQSAPMPHPSLAARLRETLVRADDMLPLLDRCLEKETTALLSAMRCSHNEIADKYLLFPVLAALPYLPRKLAEEVRALHSHVTIAEWSRLCEEASRTLEQNQKNIDARELLLVLRLLAEIPLRMDFHDPSLTEPLLGLQQRIASLAGSLQKMLA